MPPRYTFWTIILDGQPTAFRAADRETLLPTLKQLQSKNPGAVLKWFARGKVWDSPEEAGSPPRTSTRSPRDRDRHPGSGTGVPPAKGGAPHAPRGGHGEAGKPAGDGPPPDRRGKDWRPGGEHKDPREKFKKETFQARKRREKKAANLAREAGRASGVAQTSRFANQQTDRGAPQAGKRPWENRGSGRGSSPAVRAGLQARLTSVRGRIAGPNRRAPARNDPGRTAGPNRRAPAREPALGEPRA